MSSSIAVQSTAPRGHRAKYEPFKIESYEVTGEDGSTALCFAVGREAWEVPHALWSLETSGVHDDHLRLDDAWNPPGVLLVPCAGEADETDCATIITAFLTKHYAQQYV